MKKLSCYMLLLVTVLMTTSCSNSFFNINDDPNNPVNVGNEFVLTSGLSGSAYVVGGYYQALGGFWSQHYAQSTGASQWASWEEFSLDEGDFDRQFSTLYAGALMDLQVVKDRSRASSDWSYYLESTLMQSYTYSVLADLYNQIPFSEALVGIKKISPKYEDGKSICDSLISRIDFALAQNLSASTASTIGNADLIFQGNMDNWIRFGNTLKLKLYLRFVNTDPTKYASQIQALLAENKFLTVPATMTAFKNEENGRNPFYETFLDRLSGNVVASKTLLGFLKNNGDVRLDSIFLAPLDPTDKKKQKRLPQLGLGQGRYKADSGIYPSIASLSTPKVTPLAPVYFFTVPEVYFLMSEAELRYGSPENAQQDYISGINASYAMYSAAPQTALYAVDGPYEFKGLESIITQKWIAAANCTAIESFFDYNRTGYPSNFTVSAVSSLGAKFPQRLLFPDSERKANPNTPVRVSIDVKVWWAK